MSTPDTTYYRPSKSLKTQKPLSIKSSVRKTPNSNGADSGNQSQLAPQWNDFSASVPAYHSSVAGGDPGDASGLIKVVVIGESGAGKSNLIQRLTEGRFEARSKSTIGIDFALYEFADPLYQAPQAKGGSTRHRSKEEVHRPNIYKAQIWDTAGQERYRSSMTKIFYRDVAGALLVFDLTNREHYFALNRWLDEIRSNVHHSADNPHPLPHPHHIPIVLVGNKVDQTGPEEQSNIGPRAIQWAEGDDFVRRHRLVEYVETSAKTGLNVESAFNSLFANIILQRNRAAAQSEAEEAEEKSRLKGKGTFRSKSSTRRGVAREGSIKLGYSHTNGTSQRYTSRQSQPPVKQKKKCSC